MVRISIVIPFYNVEHYVAQCLESVYNQDIPEEEYEVICVNDASPDHSRDIVLEYQKKHSNLILVEHEVNKKLGAARNTGRRLARGKYLWNVDSDDMIAPYCLKEMLDFCDNNDLDVLCFAYDEYLPDGKTVKREEGSGKTGVTTGIDFIHQYGCSHLSEFCPVWRSLYRKAFLDDNNIYSPEINMGEDVPYAFKALFLSKRMSYLDNTGYVYRLNDCSLTGSKQPLSPALLYEKCFENTRLIIDVGQFIPSSDIELRASCRNVANYTFRLWMNYYKNMVSHDKNSFRTICRKNFCVDKDMLKSLISRKQYVRYLFWLFVGIIN